MRSTAASITVISFGAGAFPMREDTPRAKNKNFYFDQEDFFDRAPPASGGWSYSTSRPHAFCDPAIDHPRSTGLVFAVYTAIQRELGRAFDFPGGEKGYDAHTQFTDLGLLARAAVWMATEPRCANQSFNVVNGDWPRWRDLWEPFARGVGLEAGTARRFSLAGYMRDKGRVWDRVVANARSAQNRPAHAGAMGVWRLPDRSGFGKSARRWRRRARSDFRSS